MNPQFVTPARRFAGLALCVIGLSIGCGGEEEERFPVLSEAPPMQLDSEAIGLGLHHGDALGTALNRDGVALREGAEFFGQAFFRVKSYDEISGVVGEFHAQRIRNEQVDFTVRGPTDFPLRSPAARLSRRADDIVEELEYALDAAGASGFERRSFVVDFWRERGDWLIRWDGNLNTGTNVEGPGTYGFDRPEMTDDLLNELEAMAEAHQPEWIVVGDSMERFLAAEGYSGGIAPEQFEAYREFFIDAVGRIKAVAPETKVAAGFHWENVAGLLAEEFHGVGAGELTEEHLDEVFKAVILPFAEAGDGVGLRSYAVREEMEPWKYQFLRRLDGLYGIEIPLVFYSVSTPIDAQSAYPQQRLYLERFAQVMGGVDPEVLVWERFTNIDGVDTGDQSIVGRCAALTNPSSRLQMDVRKCYDGLLQLFFEKPAYEALRGMVQ